jgi:DUF4097 and DUF4098 domain-containing protein YvlB
MANAIKLKQGEAKTINFHITKGGVDVTDATLTLQVKEKASSSTVAITKADSDFDKADKANGNYTINFAVDDTKVLKAKTYTAELKTVITADTDVDKSYDIPFVVERAVIADV